MPQRFLNYFRDPERRIPTLRAWVWQIPLWLIGGLIMFGFNYAPNCKEGVAMTSKRMACIQSPQDKLTLLEYAICDVLDKQYERVAAVQKDSVLALTYFVQKSDDVTNSVRLDELLLKTAKEMIERDNLDSTSFYRNLKIVR